ncbi:haloacid dehalogenase type II [Sphingomonas oleivorans]|uniref:Haloacid dehalogenase type II n=1 Tax=Sphingomonas oleivorans TaxID=1735121 RepID=A0A2T5G0P8_9SPHN|nr:haloacid dehalogenase type II [Sphingomonas oleivorans]PTQ12691.1 haloacid dehalogenase type II [Sphingomonas oleivorans]
MAPLKPKYITFDCYGTLIYFEMAPVARRIYADRVKAEDMDAFCRDFSAYRLDEVLGAWKPYFQVVEGSLQRTCRKWGIAYRDEDAQAVYAAVPTWGPHPDVPEALAKVAEHFPLVILSNSMKDLIPHSVTNIGVPFHAVYTAEEAGAYKPRMQAFEYMLDMLGCGPEDILHCSSSFRYDLMTAYDMGFGGRAFVNRGHEPANPYYYTHEIKDIRGLPGLLGL